MTKNVWNENEKEEAKDVMKKATKIKLSVCFNGSAEKLVMLNNPRTFDKLLFITLWTYEWCMLITTNSPNGQCHSLIALNVCCVCVCNFHSVFYLLPRYLQTSINSSGSQAVLYYNAHKTIDFVFNSMNGLLDPFERDTHTQIMKN